MDDRIDFIQKEWDAIHNRKGQIKFKLQYDNPIFVIRTGRKFFYRLWFLIWAPIIWLIKGEIKIK